jgi:predicted transposase/invertase (TIGR01784 family)
MPGSFILKAFLLANRAEIKGMFLEDYNIETFKRDMRAEGYEEGLEEGRKEGLEDGRKEGLEEGRKDITARMLKEGLPVSLIAKISTLPESAIMDLAAKLNVVAKTN